MQMIIHGCSSQYFLVNSDARSQAAFPTESAGADEDLERVRRQFVGAIKQRPPMFSALKIGGERLYAKARRGEVLQLNPSQ